MFISTSLLFAALARFERVKPHPTPSQPQPSITLLTTKHSNHSLSSPPTAHDTPHSESALPSYSLLYLTLKTPPIQSHADIRISLGKELTPIGVV